MIKNVLIFFLALLGALNLVPITADGNTTISTSDQPAVNVTEEEETTSIASSDSATRLELNREEDSFENMTNEELEAICTNRGFELVRELDENGHERKFTRENYIDAAKQCLEVESEMEQILKEHPHLLNEIEAEAAEMRKEKKSLEEKLAEVKSELEEENEKSGERFKAAFIDDYNDNEHDTSKTGESDNNEKNIEGGEEKQGLAKSSNDDEETIDLDNCCDVSTKDNDNSGRKESENIISNNNEDRSERNSVNCLPENNDPELSVKEEGGSDDPVVTLKDIAIEFRKQIHQDFNRISNIIFPVAYREPAMKFVEPLLNVVKESMKTTYNMVKRYVTVILQDLLQNTDDTSCNNQDNKK